MFKWSTNRHVNCDREKMHSDKEQISISIKLYDSHSIQLCTTVFFSRTVYNVCLMSNQMKKKHSWIQTFCITLEANNKIRQYFATFDHFPFNSLAFIVFTLSLIRCKMPIRRKRTEMLMSSDQNEMNHIKKGKFTRCKKKKSTPKNTFIPNNYLLLGVWVRYLRVAFSFSHLRSSHLCSVFLFIYQTS